MKRGAKIYIKHNDLKILMEILASDIDYSPTDKNLNRKLDLVSDVCGKLLSAMKHNELNEKD